MIFYSASVKGFYDPSFNDVIPADAVQISVEEHATILSLLSSGYRLQSDESGYPLAVAPSDDDVRGAVWSAIKLERDRRKSLGFAADGYWFHSDPDSRIQHLALKDAARDVLAGGGAMVDALQISGQPLVWKTLSGEMVPLTVQRVFDILEAGKLQDALLFATAEAHRGAMLQSADPTQYDFSGGWPPSFVAVP